MKQLTLAAAGFERYAKTTRRAALCGLIEPFDPKAGNGRPPVGVERMLRIYFLQQWFNLSRTAMWHLERVEEEAPRSYFTISDVAEIGIFRRRRHHVHQDRRGPPQAADGGFRHSHGGDGPRLPRGNAS